MWSCGLSFVSIRVRSRERTIKRSASAVSPPTFQSASALASERWVITVSPEAECDVSIRVRSRERTIYAPIPPQGNQQVSIRVRSRERTIFSTPSWEGLTVVSIRVRSRERTISSMTTPVDCIQFQSASALASERWYINAIVTARSRFNPRPLSRANDGLAKGIWMVRKVSIRVRSRERTISSTVR